MADRVYEFAAQLDATPFVIALPADGLAAKSSFTRIDRRDDLQRAQEVVARSINDLTERHGLGPMASVRRPDFQLFSLNDDPDGLWVADDDGEIVGFAFSWVCGDLWFLSELFVALSLQGCGVGNELLAHTLDHARKTGVTNKSLITFTFNVVSQALYIRHGMLPRLPIYFFSGERRSTVGTDQHGGDLDCVSIELSSSHMLARLDLGVLGILREKHHRYLLGDATMKGVLFQEGGDCVGYAYVSETGHVGPLAVAEKRHTGAAFRTALRLAATRSAGNLSAFLPGGNEALGIALEQGLRISFPWSWHRRATSVIGPGTFLEIQASCSRCGKMENHGSSEVTAKRLLIVALVALISSPALAEPIIGQASVINGDTLEIHGQRIRLSGIDAPESDQLCRGDDSLQYRCGAKAANELDKHIAGRVVSCEGVGRDQYGAHGRGVLDRWR